MTSPFAPPFCFQREQAEREKAFKILSWQHRTHAAFLWVTSRSNGGGNGALNCLSFICLLLSPISSSFRAWRGTWAVVSARACTGSAFQLDSGTSLCFHKSMLLCVCCSRKIKRPGRLHAWRLRTASRCLQKSALRSIYKTSWEL